MSDGYIKSLDGVRAIAILLVMTFHVGLTHYGWLGVQLFFVLSGFLITGILWKERFKENNLSDKFKKFWVRRSLRIFPLYFGWLAIFGLTFLFVKFPSYYPAMIPFLGTYSFNFTRTFATWEVTPLFTHLWSLCVEEQFYLLFPLIIFLCPARFIRFFMVAVLLLSPFNRYLLGEYYKAKGLAPAVVADAVYWNTISHLDAFFMGGLIPVLALDRRWKKPHWLFLGALALALAAGVWNYLHGPRVWSFLTDLGYNHGQTQDYEHVWHYTLLNLLFASFLLTLVSVHSRRFSFHMHRCLEAGWLVRIGKVSYGMYVFHWAIQFYFFSRLIHSENYYINVLLFVPYAAIVYLFSELSFRLYEKRFIVLKDRFFAYKK
jgi:peptidoglycan/LPS O-acetylase OafA/YrhL